MKTKYFMAGKPVSRILPYAIQEHRLRDSPEAYSVHLCHGCHACSDNGHTVGTPALRNCGRSNFVEAVT